MGSVEWMPTQPSAITQTLIDAAIKGFTRTLSVNASSTHLRGHIEQQLQKLFKTHPTPDHPPYALMIRQAIEELDEVGGSDEEAISKMIKLKYQSLPWGHTSILRHHLKKLSSEGEIVVSGDCYMLPLEECDAISTPKYKRKIFYKERSTKQHKLSNNVAHSYEKQTQENEANGEHSFIDLEHNKTEVVDNAMKQNFLLDEGEREKGQQGEETVGGVKEGCYQLNVLEEKSLLEGEENVANNVQALDQEEGQQVVEGERKEAQQGKRVVEELKAGHCPHSELVAQTQLQEEIGAANILVHELGQQEGQQDEEAVEGQRKEEQQGERPVEELGARHCPHWELVSETQFEEEINAAHIQVHEQEESSRMLLAKDWIKAQGICQLSKWQNLLEDPKSAMKDKKIETLETEIEEIEELIEPKIPQEDAMNNRSTWHETQAEAGSAISDNRTHEEGSVLDGSLIPFHTSNHSREVVGSSVSSKERCLELLKRTEKITKRLYEILESFDSMERSATVGGSMLGNELVVPDVSTDRHLGRSTPPSLEQQQESRYSKDGKQPNFKIAVWESEKFAQVMNPEGQGHQNQQFETETNAMPRAIAECKPLINWEQTERRRGMLTQEQHRLIDPEANCMRTSNEVLSPFGQKNGSNMQYTVPIEEATSAYYDIQRKMICQDTTQQQLVPFTEIQKPISSNVELPHQQTMQQLFRFSMTNSSMKSPVLAGKAISQDSTQQKLLTFSEIHKPTSSNVELPREHQLSGFSELNSSPMKPPVLSGEMLKPLELAELERLTPLESRHSKMKGQPGSSSRGKGVAIGPSQSVHREVKKYARRGRPPKLKSSRDEGPSSISTKRSGRPP
ncbi:hypothetical protein SAY87_002595 [Trapa incisa]|uniref:H15 domain-containing protein n=1 Tax=Trapa incisa TaxID=236973 RepID=A0AAN7JUQ3_9MYRT|nr:hypothetical protein SAY87_002595 [Trapa incisa]